MRIDTAALLLLIMLLFRASSLLAQTSNLQQTSPETKEQRDARMKWWREARFGMFIHWGHYAIPAGEWKGGGG